jgi:periplasmic divalent cation tolerance protein
MYNPIIILTTASSDKEAEIIGSKLINNKLAACVNIIPNIKSIYRWEGKINKDSEYLLIIKTVKRAEEDVFENIRKLHSYDTPEMISIPITGGEKSYLNWLSKSVA